METYGHGRGMESIFILYKCKLKIINIVKTLNDVLRLNESKHNENANRFNEMKKLKCDY